jgi:HK97 family phage major capsid protein
MKNKDRMPKINLPHDLPKGILAVGAIHGEDVDKRVAQVVRNAKSGGGGDPDVWSAIADMARLTKEVNQSVLGRVDELQVVLQDVTQRVAAMPTGGRFSSDFSFGPSAIQGFLEDGRVQAVQKGAQSSGRVMLEGVRVDQIRAETLLSTQTDGGTVPVVPQRDGELRGLAQRPLSLLDLIPRIQVSSNLFEFVQVGESFANAADFQAAEGALKAEQSLPLEMQEAKIGTIAAWIRASVQVLDDVPAFRQQIGQLLTNGLLDKLEATIIASDGTGPGSFVGLLPQATPMIAMTGVTPADRIGEAVASLAASGWKPSAVLVNPMDWFAMRSERSEADGHYTANTWLDQPSRTAWGVNVITTSSLPRGRALVADLSQVALLDRMQATLMVSREDRDNFVRNLVTVLAELRTGLAVFAPSALLSVDLSLG